MYADYSRDQVNALLADLTSQPEVGAVEHMAETFSDDTIMVQMELARFKAAREAGKAFVPRIDALPSRARRHPADMI